MILHAGRPDIPKDRLEALRIAIAISATAWIVRCPGKIKMDIGDANVPREPPQQSRLNSQSIERHAA